MFTSCKLNRRTGFQISVVRALFLFMLSASASAYCPSPPAGNSDWDGDGICRFDSNGNRADTCVRIATGATLQPDSNGDGVGDACVSPMPAGLSPSVIDDLIDWAVYIDDGALINGDVVISAPLKTGVNVELVGTTKIEGGSHSITTLGNNARVVSSRLNRVIAGDNFTVNSGGNLTSVLIGDGVRVSGGSTIQGFFLGNTSSTWIVLEDNVRVYANVNLTGYRVLVREGTLIRSGVNLSNIHDVIIGRNVRVGLTNADATNGNDDIRIGSYVTIGDGVYIGPGVTIGDNVYIQPGTRIPDNLQIPSNTSYPTYN